MFKNENFISLTQNLKIAQKEDLRSFTDMYNKAYNIHNERCPCEVAANFIGPYRHGYSPTKLIYILKTEKDFTRNDCIKYLLLNTDYLNGNIGIKNAAKFYFNKPIEKLNINEKTLLIARLKNPVLYDPIRNPIGVKNRIGVLQSVLRKSTH